MLCSPLVVLSLCVCNVQYTTTKRDNKCVFEAKSVTLNRAVKSAAASKYSRPTWMCWWEKTSLPPRLSHSQSLTIPLLSVSPYWRASLCPPAATLSPPPSSPQVPSHSQWHQRAVSGMLSILWKSLSFHGNTPTRREGGGRHTVTTFSFDYTSAVLLCTASTQLSDFVAGFTNTHISESFQCKTLHTKKNTNTNTHTNNRQLVWTWLDDNGGCLALPHERTNIHTHIDVRDTFSVCTHSRTNWCSE